MAKSNWYMSQRWLKTRERILRRDGYFDRIEKRYGRRKAAELVHHIFPREDFPEYQWCEWNLISVSRATHNTLHERNTNKLTKAGVDLLVRTARKNNIEIPEEYRNV